jgi:hypothetical protein
MSEGEETLGFPEAELEGGNEAQLEPTTENARPVAESAADGASQLALEYRGSSRLDAERLLRAVRDIVDLAGRENFGEVAALAKDELRAEADHFLLGGMLILGGFVESLVTSITTLPQALEEEHLGVEPNETSDEEIEHVEE